MRNAHCLFLKKPEPVLVGFGIIVPVWHRETGFQLIPDEWEATLALLHEVKALVDGEYAPHGYNVGWNCGRVAGQAVFHAHLNVIPRHADELLTGKSIRYWLKQDTTRRCS